MYELEHANVKVKKLIKFKAKSCIISSIFILVLVQK